MAGSGALKYLLVCCVAVLCCQLCSANQNRLITNSSYLYTVKNETDGTVCLTMSFTAELVISYLRTNNDSNQTNPTYNVTTKAFSVPNRSLVTVDGNCSDSSGNSTFRYMSLTWKEGGEENFTLTFNFTVTKKEWYLSQIRVEFEMSDNTFEMPKDTGQLSYQTKGNHKFFNRTFNGGHYFYCKACKKFFLLVQDQDASGNGSNNTRPCFKVPTSGKDNATTTSSCSFLQLSSSVIYPGNISSGKISKKLCLEDFIELQEIIIPSVVGGVLGLLLFIIFTSYLIAYVRRKRREGRYEAINDNVY